MLMIVSATGDPRNVDTFTAGDVIPEWRLVPNDNNVG
jgi:zinc metalloprotease ZmpB